MNLTLHSQKISIFKLICIVYIANCTQTLKKNLRLVTGRYIASDYTSIVKQNAFLSYSTLISYSAMMYKKAFWISHFSNYVVRPFDIHAASGKVRER